MPGEVDSKLTGCEAPVGWPSVRLRSPGHVGPRQHFTLVCLHVVAPLVCSALNASAHWGGTLALGASSHLAGLRVLCLGPAPSVALAEALGRLPCQAERLEDGGACEAPRALLTW